MVAFCPAKANVTKDILRRRKVKHLGYPGKVLCLSQPQIVTLIPPFPSFLHLLVPVPDAKRAEVVLRGGGRSGKEGRAESEDKKLLGSWGGSSPGLTPYSEAQILTFEKRLKHPRRLTMQ